MGGVGERVRTALPRGVFHHMLPPVFPRESCVRAGGLRRLKAAWVPRVPLRSSPLPATLPPFGLLSPCLGFPRPTPASPHTHTPPRSSHPGALKGGGEPLKPLFYRSLAAGVRCKYRSARQGWGWTLSISRGIFPQ